MDDVTLRPVSFNPFADGAINPDDFKVAPDVQESRDRARMQILLAELKDNPDDEALKKEIQFEQQKPGRGTQIATEMRKSNVTLRPVDFDPFAAPSSGVRPSDLVKSAVAGVAGGAGAIVQGGGELLARGINMVGGKLGFDPEARAINPLQGAVNDLMDAQTPAAKKAEANSQISGELLKPSDWSFGNDPSVAGIALQGMNAIGQMAPNLAVALITAGASVPVQLAIGATVGGLQGLGAGADQEREAIGKMNHEELMAGSALYKELIGRGVPQDTAKSAVAEAAALGGGLGNAIPSAGEGAFENFLIGALTKGKIKIPSLGAGVAGRVATGIVGGGAMGGAEEAIEQGAQNVGSNVAIGGDRPVGQDTLQNFVMGMIAEGVAGGGAGALSKSHGQAQAENANVRQEVPVAAETTAPVQAAEQPVPAPAASTSEPIEYTPPDKGLALQEPPVAAPAQPAAESIPYEPVLNLSPIEQARKDAEVLKTGGIPVDADDTRLRNATLISIYGENAAVRHAIENPALSAVGDAMLLIAPKVEQVRKSLSQSEQSRDITTDVMTAIDELARIKAAGSTVAEIMKQGFPGGVSYEAEQLMQFLDQNAANPQKVADFMERYLQVVQDMGGVPSDVRGKAFDIISERNASKREAEEAQARAQVEGAQAKQVKTETQIATEQARAENALTEMAKARVAGSGINTEHMTAMEIAFQNARQLKEKKSEKPVETKPGPETRRAERVPVAAETREASESRPVRESGAAQSPAAEVKPASKKEEAKAMVEEASKQAAHSPHNDRPLPTDAQHKAGNYPKGHVNLFGMNISIENPKGSVRSGVDKEGTPWQLKMQNPYGYIRKTEGADGDHVDVYLGDHLTEESPVFIVDQIDPDTKKFDEHKVILGARGFGEAKEIYDNNFSDDSAERRRGAVVKKTLPEFKEWLKGDTTKPVKYKEPKSATPAPTVTAEPSKEDSGAPAAAEPVAANSPERQQTPDNATTPAVERFAGLYDKGMTEFNAKQQQKRLTAERPELDWKVEPAPQFGDQRFDIGGYPTPKFSRDIADNIPAGFTIDEGNRESTDVLNAYYRQQGKDIVAVPLTLRPDIDVNDKGGQAKNGETLARSGQGEGALSDPADANLAQKLAAIFGKRIVFLTTNAAPEFAGVTFPGAFPNEIFIDVRSKRLSHVLVGHELTHHMEADAPEIYARLRKSIDRLLVHHDEYRKINALYPSEDAAKEMIGDLLGDNFNDPEFWNLVSKENPVTFGKISKYVIGWLNDLIDRVRGKLGFGSERFVSDMQAAKVALVQATAEYANRGSRIASELDDRIVPKFSRNLGTLTPAQEAALRNVHGDQLTWQARLNAFKADWKKRLVQGVFDQYAPILDYTQKGYRLARQAKGGDSTLEALLTYGKVFVDPDGAYRVDYDPQRGMNGFAKVIGELHGEQDRFLEWVAAQRAERLASVGLENLYSAQDIAALKALDQGTMKDGGARPAAYARALRELNDWNDSVLKIAADSGLIDDATRLMYKDMPYVPFYRLQEDGVAGFGMKAGLVNQSAWKKLKGGTAHLNDDLLANLLQNWSHMITASAKNRAAKETLQAAQAAGVAQQVPSGTPGKGLVHYMDAGKEKVFTVADAHLLDAIAAMHYAGLGDVGKPFITMKRWLTTGVTINPAFKIRNLIRDSIQAIGTAELSYNPLKNIRQGFKATTEESATRAQLLAGGGMIRFGSMLDGNNADRTRRLIEHGVDPQYILDSASKLEKLWKQRLLPAFEAYQELGDRGEQISRAALYEQLLDKGMTHEEAAFWARDLMDFSLSGKWAAVRILTQVVPFMNARLQGLYKLGRATKADYRRMGTTLGAVALSSMALLLAYKDDDDWKKREDFDRDNYWWFKIGDVAFRLPKPFEVGAVGTLAERGLEYMISDEMTGSRFAERVSATVFNQLSMNPTPQLVKPLMDLYANKDSFTGRPIETMGMERLRKEDRATERTSEIAKALGQLGLPDPTQLAMGQWNTLSPVQIDSLVKGYFGWIGTSASTALDWGIRPMMDRGQRPDMKLKEVFLAGNFLETLPTASSRYVTQLYDQAAAIEQAYGSYRDAVKRGDFGKAQEVLADEAEKISKYKLVETIKRGESDISSQIRVIEASKTMPGEQKRVRIDRLNDAKNKLAQLLATQI